MADRFRFEIELTPEQRAQIRQAWGREIDSLKVTPDDWPQRFFRESWDLARGLIRVGRSLAIAPAGMAIEPGDTGRVILLDPNEAAGRTVFGSGAHVTTQLALVLLEERLTPGDRVLDLGTGSGILAMAAARLGASEVLALDVDPVAAAAARRNADLNGLDGVVQVREGSVEAAAGAPYDLVVANLLANILRPLAPALPGLVRPGGLLLVSGIVAARVPDLTAALIREGFELEEEREHPDWRALVLRRSGDPQVKEADRDDERGE
jgi:ribosomal protein L11 methyltransferase